MTGRILAELDLILAAATALDSRVDTIEAVGGDALTLGQTSMRRADTNTTGVTQASQTLRLAYFTAYKTETSTQVQVWSGGTAAGATPTLCRVGLYSVDGAGAGTLVASTANDTALFATQNTAYTKSWSAPYGMMLGQRYALASLVVTAAAAPTLTGWLGAAVGGLYANAPRMGAALAGQADLPASFTDASLTASSFRVYGAILP